MFAIESDEHDKIGAVQHRNEARLHRHAVRVFDAGGEAANLNLIAADIARKVGEIREGGDNADFGRAGRSGAKCDGGDGGQRQETEQFGFHKILLSKFSVVASRVSGRR